MIHELIVYACPTGPLANELADYFQRSRQRFGENSAHAFPPHITLTGFFHDDAAALPGTVAALDRVLSNQRPAPAGAIRCAEVLFRPDFHALLMDAPWARRVANDFAVLHDVLTAHEPTRVKTDLHLSLAYGFPETQHEGLQELAMSLIDPRSPVAWEVRLYERAPAGQWLVRGVWAVD